MLFSPNVICAHNIFSTYFCSEVATADLDSIYDAHPALKAFRGGLSALCARSGELAYEPRSGAVPARVRAVGQEAISRHQPGAGPNRSRRASRFALAVGSAKSNQRHDGRKCRREQEQHEFWYDQMVRAAVLKARRRRGARECFGAAANPSMAPRIERRRRRAERDLSTSATQREAQKRWKAGRALPGGGRWALRGGALYYIRAGDLAPQGRAAERAREVAERAERKELMLEQLARSYRYRMEEGFDDSLGGAQAQEDVERSLRERSRISRLTHVLENLQKQRAAVGARGLAAEGVGNGWFAASTRQPTTLTSDSNLHGGATDCAPASHRATHYQMQPIDVEGSLRLSNRSGLLACDAPQDLPAVVSEHRGPELLSFPTTGDGCYCRATCTHLYLILPPTQLSLTLASPTLVASL